MARKQLFLVLLLLQLCLVSCHADQQTARPGENITLECLLTSKELITAVTWKRTDLKNYVFFWRDRLDRQKMERGLHPSFVTRTHLADPDMKDGNVSITINHVAFNDSGVYECYSGGGSKVELIRSITLTVADPERRTGNTATAAGGSVALIVGMLVAVMIFHP